MSVLYLTGASGFFCLPVTISLAIVHVISFVHMQIHNVLKIFSFAGTATFDACHSNHCNEVRSRDQVLLAIALMISRDNNCDDGYFFKGA